jgi:hypothetical protein
LCGQAATGRRKPGAGAGDNAGVSAVVAVEARREPAAGGWVRKRWNGSLSRVTTGVGRAGDFGAGALGGFAGAGRIGDPAG